MAQITMFKKISDRLLASSDIHLQVPQFTFQDGLKVKRIIMKEAVGNTYFVDGRHTVWNPKDFSMNVTCDLFVNSPNKLFGEDGVTFKDNVIGVGMQIYSKDSRFQQVITFGEIRDTDVAETFTFQCSFTKNVLRGAVFFRPFLYLKEIYEKLPTQATTVGVELSDDNLGLFQLNVDGSERLFPIHEFHDKKGPLWQLKTYYSNPGEDSFSSETIQLQLNKEHDLFDRLTDRKNKLNQSYMGNILIDCMSMLTFDVLQDESIYLDDPSTYDVDSIANVVKYWVETFEIDEAFEVNVNLIRLRNQFETQLENKFLI